MIKIKEAIPQPSAEAYAEFQALVREALNSDTVTLSSRRLRDLLENYSHALEFLKRAQTMINGIDDLRQIVSRENQAYVKESVELYEKIDELEHELAVYKELLSDAQ